MAGTPSHPERLLDCTEPEQRASSLERAAAVVREGKVVVLPTDTVYGVGADAFDEVAVAMVLAAKHRGREMPPPVLVPGARTVDGLAVDVPMYARILMRHFWPGPLTLVLRSQPSLRWDLGETNGTVAVRVPDDEVALALLQEVGPLAVTSANVTGSPAATTAQEAMDQLAGAVAVYLDDGPRTGGAASTILDCTGEEPVVLRAGSLAPADIRAVLGTTVLHDHPPVEPGAASEDEGDAADEAAGEGAGVGPGGGDRPGSSGSDGASLVGSVRPSAVPVPGTAYRVVPPPSGRA